MLRHIGENYRKRETKAVPTIISCSYQPTTTTNRISSQVYLVSHSFALAALEAPNGFLQSVSCCSSLLPLTSNPTFLFTRSRNNKIRITGKSSLSLSSYPSVLIVWFLLVPIVVAADGLSKRDVFRLPDPFAVITVDAEQTHTTSVMKKTLNPYWNESFDM